MEGSMRGSGIYCEDVTRDIECHCDQDGCKTDERPGCGKEFTQDVTKDDWGNIEEEVQCPQCSHEFTYTEEVDEIGGDDPDRMHDELGEW